jgi:hypothetical protein
MGGASANERPSAFARGFRLRGGLDAPELPPSSTVAPDMPAFLVLASLEMAAAFMLMLTAPTLSEGLPSGGACTAVAAPATAHVDNHRPVLAYWCRPRGGTLRPGSARLGRSQKDGLPFRLRGLSLAAQGHQLAHRGGAAWLLPLSMGSGLGCAGHV